MRNPPRRLRWSECRDFYRRLGELGLLALAWPREFGGAGLSPRQQLVFMQEQDRWGVARAPDMGITMVGPGLIRYGTPAQRERYLPAILRFDHMWCQGFSEPNAGSDLASLRTRAVRDGDVRELELRRDAGDERTDAIGDLGVGCRHRSVDAGPPASWLRVRQPSPSARRGASRRAMRHWGPGAAEPLGAASYRSVTSPP